MDAPPFWLGYECYEFKSQFLHLHGEFFINWDNFQTLTFVWFKFKQFLWIIAQLPPLCSTSGASNSRTILEQKSIPLSSVRSKCWWVWCLGLTTLFLQWCFILFCLFSVLSCRKKKVKWLVSHPLPQPQLRLPKLTKVTQFCLLKLLSYCI